MIHRIKSGYALELSAPSDKYIIASKDLAISGKVGTVVFDTTNHFTILDGWRNTFEVIVPPRLNGNKSAIENSMEDVVILATKKSYSGVYPIMRAIGVKDGLTKELALAMLNLKYDNKSVIANLANILYQLDNLKIK